MPEQNMDAMLAELTQHIETMRDALVVGVEQIKQLQARLAAVEAERDAARLVNADLSRKVEQAEAERDNALRYIELLIAERDAARAEAEKEERECHQVIAERDEHEERLNRIFSALGMDEAESEWSSANDPALTAIGKAEELCEALLAAQSGEARAVEALRNLAKDLQRVAADVRNHGNARIAHARAADKVTAAFNSLDSQPALNWLAQREAEAVAKWIEQEAWKARRTMGEYYERSVEGMLEEAAALRAGKGVGDA